MYFFVLRQSELGGRAPTLIQIVPVGDFKDGAGRKFRVTQEQAETMVQNFNKRENDLVIDYEHQTLTGAKAPAAGWIKKLINKGEDGLWAEVEWTDQGRRHIEEKEYRYLSPVLFSKKKDGEVGLPEKLHSAALTNDPAIDGMVPLISKDQPPTEKEHDMKEFLEKLAEKMNITYEALVAKLAIEGEVTDEKLIDSVVVLAAKSDQPLIKIKEIIPPALLTALELEETATASEAEASILAMKQGGNAEYELRLKKLQDELGGMKSEQLVAKAMEAGKVPAAQKEWALQYAQRDPAGFETYISKAVAVVPMDKTDPAPEDAPGKVSEDLMLVANMLGNSEEDLVKFGGLQKQN